jgi:hypothetical protein
MVRYLRDLNIQEGARWPLVAVCVVAGVAIALALWAAYDLVTDDNEAVVSTPLAVSLPDEWAKTALASDDPNAGVIYRAARAEPDASLVVRTVTAPLPDDFDMEPLAAETEAALAAEVDGFELVSSSVTLLADKDAVSIVYRHGAEEQSRMVILPAANQTYYVVLTFASSDAPALEEDAAALFESIARDLD